MPAAAATSSAVRRHRSPACVSTLVLCTRVSRPRRRAASPAAYRTQRSTPARVFRDSSVALSNAVPRCTVPPAPAYRPSVFSRTITKSRSAAGGRATAPATPGRSFHGRRFTYRATSARSRSARPPSTTPGGPPGLPTPPTTTPPPRRVTAPGADPPGGHRGPAAGAEQARLGLARPARARGGHPPAGGRVARRAERVVPPPGADPGRARARAAAPRGDRRDLRADPV